MKISLKHLSLKKLKSIWQKGKLKDFWQKYKQRHCFCLAKNFWFVLHRKEKTAFAVLTILALSSLFFLALNFYLANTEKRPGFGGTIVEAVVGQPRFINPVYLSSRDVDRDIVEILFSGLMKYNGKGEIVEDLAQIYEVKDDGKIWEFVLKENVLWHDNVPLTADDIVFTVKLIQNPDAESPQRVKWLGVTVEKVSDLKVRFQLKKGYSGFLETATLKILPKHIFENISPKNLPWSLTSKDHLVGSGPFKVKDLKQDNKSGYLTKLVLERNSDYFSQKPYLAKISFCFFKDEASLLKEAGRGGIDSFLVSDARNVPLASLSEFNLWRFSMPQYFGVFFNKIESTILADKKVREALSYGFDKTEILTKVFAGNGSVVNSPLLNGFYGFSSPSTVYEFNKEKAGELLDEAGFKYIDDDKTRKKIIVKSTGEGLKQDLAYGSKNSQVTKLQECLAQDKEVYPEGKITGYFGKQTKEAVIRFQEKYRSEILAPSGLTKGTGAVKAKTREKLNELCFPAETETVPLEISLATSENSLLLEIAEILQKAWEEIGVKLNIEAKPISVLETDIIKPRDFEALLFGEILGYVPDPFPFWHSSQKDYPGLNITKYLNKKADSLLEKAREAASAEQRKENLEKFQDVLIEDLPCLFLVQPDLVYVVSKKIKGIESDKAATPANRFSNIENWYIKIKRSF